MVVKCTTRSNISNGNQYEKSKCFRVKKFCNLFYFEVLFLAQVWQILRVKKVSH